MESVQKYTQDDGAVGVDNKDRWPSDSDAVTFLAETTSAASARELRKRALLRHGSQKEVLMGCFVFVTDAGEFTWYNESSTLGASFYYRWPQNGEDAARSARGLGSGCCTPLCAPLQPHNRKHWHGMTSFPRKTLRTLNLKITSCVIPGHYPELILENIGTQSDLKSLCGVSKYVAEFATPRRQENIRSISLLTDGGCPTFAYEQYFDLSSFTSLQSLSWKGLSRSDHFDCFEGFVKNAAGARRLRSLVLDLVDWKTAENGWYEHEEEYETSRNFFATRVLGIEPAGIKVLFQSLETLLLVGVNFAPFANEFVHSFNMLNLSTLQLRNCPSSLELLGALLEEGVTLKLKSFELVIDWDCLHNYRYRVYEQALTEVIVRFLASFQGLEDLFLLLTQPLEWHSIANSIANHQSTLKRLVLHDRDTPNNDVVDGGIPWQNSEELLSHSPRLSCFGTSGPVSKMESAFAQLPVKPKCRILTSKCRDTEPLINSGSGGKFPTYPRTETLNEAVGLTIQKPHVRNHGCSKDFRDLAYGYGGSNGGKLIFNNAVFGLAKQNAQISTRTQRIANRSDFSGPAQALLKFARWAFSSEGIPELQILAWGDFSHDGRWGESNVILCRDQSFEPTGTNFRRLRDSDLNYWDMIDGNMDMLSACSPDHVLRTEYWHS
ncbi:hypothetical protein V494_00025 [Pseudogymnoascus sp. VKM F-4513 (FW-928)]|nr:hypothetical protein V494_00025 [Pseudogymnoascus sp. VKM F-4513 (FW-928)]